MFRSGGEIDSFNQTIRGFEDAYQKNLITIYGYARANYFSDGVANGGGTPPNTGGDGAPIKKTDTGDTPDKDQKQKDDGYLNYKWSGLDYNEDAFNKVKDYYFNAGASKIEREVMAGKHATIKAVTPEIEEQLSLAGKASEYKKALTELKKGNQLDPEKYNQEIIAELDSVKKRSEENLRLTEEKYTKEIQERDEKIDSMKRGIVETAISSRLRPKLITPDNESDQGMQLSLKAFVRELASRVEIEDDLNMKIVVEENGEKVYADKIVENKSVPMTIDDLCNEFIQSTPLFAQASDMKSGAGTKPGMKGKGSDETHLFKWQNQGAHEDFQPREQ